MRGNLFQIDGLLRETFPTNCLIEQGYRKGKPRNVPSLVVMSGLVGGRYLTHFIALVVLGLLDRGDQLIINCLLRVAFQILARESSVPRADSAYPLGHGRAGRLLPEAGGWGPAGTLAGPLDGPGVPSPDRVPSSSWAFPTASALGFLSLQEIPAQGQCLAWSKLSQTAPRTAESGPSAEVGAGR